MILSEKQTIKIKERKRRRKGPKIFFLCVHFFLLILTILLLPLNVFVVNFPEWVVVLCGGLTLAVLIVYLIVFRTKTVTKILLPIPSVLVVVFISLVTYCCPYWNSYSFKQIDTVWLNYDEELTYEQAAEDLAAAIHHLEHVHPLFRDGLTPDIRERYDASLNTLKEMQTITVNDLRRELQIVINPLHDAHTTTYNSWPDDRYLADIPKKKWEGYTIYSVNGRTIEEIVEAAAPYYSYETTDWIMVDVGSLASLLFYGYEEPFTFEWKNEDGDIVTEIYTSDNFIAPKYYTAMMTLYDYYAEESNAEEESAFVSYEIDEEKSLARLTLTSCNYNDEYIRCVREMFQEVREKQIKNVAIDVRGNGGGDSRVANEVIKYLPVTQYRDVPFDWRWGWFVFSYDGWIKNKQYEDLLFDGEVYVLTDSSSFSSAMDFAQLIQDNGLGAVIGIAPANAVNGYGDVALFTLPNSGMMMQISTKKWYRIDESNPNDYVVPDYPGEDALALLYSVLQ